MPNENPEGRGVGKGGKVKGAFPRTCEKEPGGKRKEW